MCCRGTAEIDTSALHRNNDINKVLTNDKKRLSEEVRLLLLGAGESGKSTIAKQMKIIHMGGFNTEEKHEYISAIHSNIYDSVQSIVKASEVLGVPFESKENEQFGLSFLEPFTAPRLTPQQGEEIGAFWADKGVQELFNRRNEFQMLDNTEYYACNIKRICAKNYEPTELDVLSSRVQTTGVIETAFMVNDRKFIMVDVGGQRSERKKWMHCFQSVTGVLFCVGLSAFDQTLYEDHQTNRMHEALRLFHEICMSKWFTSTAIILFLNKEDLFRKKIAAGKSIRAAFPEYSGNDTFDESIAFITEKFLDVIDPTTNQPKDIYAHVTTATDTQNVAVVFEAVKDSVMSQAFKMCGLED